MATAPSPRSPSIRRARLAQAIEAKNTITVYERASQLELISRLETAYALGSPVPPDVLDRFGLIQKRVDIPGNVYRDVIIYRAGYHLTRLDRLLMEKLRESAKAGRTGIKQYRHPADAGLFFARIFLRHTHRSSNVDA